jgi:hypothetical protein
LFVTTFGTDAFKKNYLSNNIHSVLVANHFDHVLKRVLRKPVADGFINLLLDAAQHRFNISSNRTILIGTAVMERKYLSARNCSVDFGKVYLGWNSSKPCPAGCTGLRYYQLSVSELAQQTPYDHGVGIYASGDPV